MTKITQLPVVSTMADQSVFVVVDNGVTKKLTYSTLKATLKGDKGETGLTGPKGDTGEKGEKGDTGATGAQGPVGPLAPFSTATDIRLGGIKIGTGIYVAGDGTLSVPPPTVITTATDTAYGAVSVGTGLNIDGTGKLSIVSRLYRSSAKEFRFSVVNDNYRIDGYVGDNPSVSLEPGSTYAFDLTDVPSTQPLQLRLTNGGQPVTDGQWVFVTANGVVTSGPLSANTGRYGGTLFWTVPDSPATYTVYYQSTQNSGAVSQITIENQSQFILNEIETLFGAVDTTIVPKTDVTYNLGSPAKRWHSLYLGSNSIDINNVVLSESNGLLTSTGGFDTGKSITKINVTSGGKFADNVGFTFTDSQGRGLVTKINLTPTSIEKIRYQQYDDDYQPTDVVTVIIDKDPLNNGPWEGSGAQASATMDYFISNVYPLYRTTPSATWELSSEIVLSDPPSTTVSLQTAQALSAFLAYQDLADARDGLSTFVDPSDGQLKVLKLASVDTVTGVITFDPLLANATIPASTWVFEVPVATLTSGTYPILCEGVQVGKLVVRNDGSYFSYIADKLDSSRLGTATAGSYIPITCAGLGADSGLPGWYYLAGLEQADSDKFNQTKIRYGITDIVVDDGGLGYNNPNMVAVINVNGTPFRECHVQLTPTPISSIDVLDSGEGYSDASVATLGIYNGCPKTSNSNVWKVVPENLIGETTEVRTKDSVIFVTNANLDGAFIPDFVCGTTITNGVTAQTFNLDSPIANNKAQGTVLSVTPIWQTTQFSLLRVVMSQSSTVEYGDFINFNLAPSVVDTAEISLNKQAARPVLPATTSTLGTVTVGEGLGITQEGVLSLQLRTPPPTSKGEPGDKAGVFAVDTGFFYYCVADYTTGTANIWKRVNWSVQTW